MEKILQSRAGEFFLTMIAVLFYSVLLLLLSIIFLSGGGDGVMAPCVASLLFLVVGPLYVFGRILKKKDVGYRLFRIAAILICLINFIALLVFITHDAAKLNHRHFDFGYFIFFGGTWFLLWIGATAYPFRLMHVIRLQVFRNEKNC